ncbi:MAG: S24 family peptidase [Porphyromonadaceae bacterium]|nr:S24 family peptidase [Porphyromonadaceae bacterium]
MIDKTLSRVLVLDSQVFFAQILKDLEQGKRVTIFAKGWSMLPMIWQKRDTLLLAPLTKDSISQGRIVLAQLSDKRFVIHRIAKMQGDRLTLRGDGNPYQIEQCTKAQVLAELVGVTRNGKMLLQGTIRWRLFEHLWPSHPLARRILLRIYRSINSI